MPTTFPLPSTDAETIEHLRTRHGTFVKSLTEWQALFGAMRSPARAHQDMHAYDSRRRGAHRHTEWARTR